jgi:hypothetical protein
MIQEAAPRRTPTADRQASMGEVDRSWFDRADMASGQRHERSEGTTTVAWIGIRQTPAVYSWTASKRIFPVAPSVETRSVQKIIEPTDGYKLLSYYLYLVL